jgi:hypothetical protein
MKTGEEQFNEWGDFDASPDIPDILIEIYDDLELERDKYLRHREEEKVNDGHAAEQRDALQDALREMVAAKGRFNTQNAMERLIALLPENQTNQTP